MFTKTILEKADKLEQEALYDKTLPKAKRYKKHLLVGLLKGQ